MCLVGHGVQAGHLFERCVAPMVESLFRGLNATVLAYGQTGSGKTYTMDMLTPSVVQDIFDGVASAPPHVGCTVRVSLVELYQEKFRDLLHTGRGLQPEAHIGQAPAGGVCLAGAVEREVLSWQDLEEVLEQGMLQRATAATGMNQQSSRSHAVLTMIVEQERLVGLDAEQPTISMSGITARGSKTVAKLHLVDLAGSERMKRTGAEGQRAKEGININRSLSALCNVINVLSQPGGRAHVPYYDSKLTHMLQDSLGGNSRTLMVACVSPADVDLEETLSTLRYACRARDVRNRPVVNQVASRLAEVLAENADLKRQLEELGGAGQRASELQTVVEQLQARCCTLKEDKHHLQADVAAKQQEGLAWQERVEQLQAQLLQAQAQVQQLPGAETEIDQLRQLAEAAKREEQRLRTELAASAEQVAQLQTQAETAAGAEQLASRFQNEQQLQQLQRLEQAEQEVERLRAHAAVQEAAATELLDQLAGVQAKAAAAASQGEVHGFRVQAGACPEEAETEEEEEEEAGQSLAQRSKRRLPAAEREARISHLEAEAASMRQEQEEIRVALAAKEREPREMEQQLRLLQDAAVAGQEEREQLQARIRLLERRLEQQQAGQEQDGAAGNQGAEPKKRKLGPKAAKSAFLSHCARTRGA